jgi:hypothetical protein
MTSDESVLAAINALEEERHELLRSEADHTATDQDRQRASDIEIEVDRCWDLLRQRRAHRDARQDPDTATVRTESVVEHYLQ